MAAARGPRPCPLSPRPADSLDPGRLLPKANVAPGAVYYTTKAGRAVSRQTRTRLPVGAVGTSHLGPGKSPVAL